jgi:hypothetical protein
LVTHSKAAAKEVAVDKQSVNREEVAADTVGCSTDPTLVIVDLGSHTEVDSQGVNMPF